MAASTRRTGLTLTLSGAEREELLRLLERELGDTRVDARRTESPDFRDDVHDRENTIQGL